MGLQGSSSSNSVLVSLNKDRVLFCLIEWAWHNRTTPGHLLVTGHKAILIVMELFILTEAAFRYVCMFIKTHVTTLKTGCMAMS